MNGAIVPLSLENGNVIYEMIMFDIGMTKRIVELASQVCVRSQYEFKITSYCILVMAK